MNLCSSTVKYAQGMVHTNSIENFWALLKRDYYGTFHHMNHKHPHHYIADFEDCHNAGQGTMCELTVIVREMMGSVLHL